MKGGGWAGESLPRDMSKFQKRGSKEDRAFDAAGNVFFILPQLESPEGEPIISVLAKRAAV